MFTDKDKTPPPPPATDDNQPSPLTPISEETLQEIVESQKLGVEEDNSVDILHKP